MMPINISNDKLFWYVVCAFDLCDILLFDGYLDKITRASALSCGSTLL